MRSGRIQDVRQVRGRRSRRPPVKNIPLPVILIGATLITLIVFGLFSFVLFGRKSRRPEMIITSSSGEVMINKKRSGKWEPAENYATPFYQGCSIRTDAGGSAVLCLSDEQFFGLGSSTELSITTLAKGSEPKVKYDVLLNLLSGRLWVERNAKIKISVNTPAALVSPDLGACEIATDGVSLRVLSFFGSAEYTPHINEDKVTTVPEGFESIFLPKEKKILMPKPFKTGKLDEWEKQNLSIFRDREAMRRLQNLQQRGPSRKRSK